MIFYRYAKILSDSEGFGRANEGHVSRRFKQLVEGEIDWQASMKRILVGKENGSRCVFCGNHASLARGYLIPITRGGPDIEDNTILACGLCRIKKGDRRLYEWYGLKQADKIPIAAETKYLKLLHNIHDKRGTLNESDVQKLCVRCDMENLCPEKQKLTVYCLEGCFLKK